MRVEYPLLAPQAGRSEAVVIAQGVEPTTLDPQNQQETAVANLAVNIFDTLIERDEQLRLVPLLAEAYRSVGPTVWEFRLRRGVRFHNGEVFDAGSVKFTFERLINPALKLRQAASYAPLSHVEIIDEYTLRIHTRRPWPILPNMMTTAAMLAPGHYGSRELADVAGAPVGTGPFRFVRWHPGDGIALESNLDYWRGAPEIKSLLFCAIPDDAARAEALQQGEVDLAVNIPPHLVSALASSQRLSVSSVPSVRTIQLIHYTHEFDADHRLVGPHPSPVADRRVRMAIAYAIDADALIQRVLDGRAIRLATMLTPKHFGFDAELRPIRPDLRRVRELLANAGYRDGLELVLNAPRGRYMRDMEIAHALGDMLTAAGIHTTVQCHDWGAYLNELAYRRQAGPMWLFGWGTTHYDAETMYVPLFRSGKPLSNYFSPRFDAMLDTAQITMDPGKREELYHAINREWLADAPAVPLYQQIDIYGASRRLAWTARGDERLKAFNMGLVC